MDVLRSLAERGYSLTRLARARGLDPKHVRNALHGRTRLGYDEMAVLTDALDQPITEIVPDDVLERAMR